ncbi:YlqD family protein [Leptolyngbya sp. FACHB-261]|uniref:YlqD family protein n=1 Tax=Leptolyngbya sp. FACHB-261 TaxID=2692806 RepID=UPI001683EDA1|nr:YlqD family protein [Leptolyngbya sp. FACHB-261]MBD2102014.1 YlqD family protein [Leptolyngbya sp. FACHB-261]
MDLASSLLLKRNVTIKAVVTPRWRDEAQQQLQAQLNQLDGEIQRVEQQYSRMLSEIQKQSIQLPTGPSGASKQQLDDLQLQFNNRKAELLNQKNQVLQQLNQVQILEMGQEVVQGQLDSYFQVNKGDNLVGKMQVEILLRDGIIEAIRGEI